MPTFRGRTSRSGNGSGPRIELGPESAAGVQIRSARNVMLDHFWLGVGEANGNGNGHSNGRAAKAANGSRPSRAPRAALQPAAGRAG